jgi:Uma2 family endonuclease
MVTATGSRYTRADYMRLPEGYPAQLIEGQLIRDPSPAPWHQSVVYRIGQELGRVVRTDRVLLAPMDVFLDEHNVLQPDVLVLAERDRVHPGLREVPLPLVVLEVLSPSSATRDRSVKTRLYLEAGVREVWLVDLESRSVEIRTPEGGTACPPGSIAASAAVPGFSLSLRELLGDG